MPSQHGDTKDPIEWPGRVDGDTAKPVVEILSHSDLRRVGAKLDAPGFAAGEPVVIGRDRGLFDGEPLLDPCISREQLQLRYLPKKRVFEVRAAEDGRRKITVVDRAGVGVDPSVIPPGSLVAIGDRCLLLLDRRSAEHGSGDLGLIGDAPATRALRDRIRAVAQRQDAVLIEGQTGSGKDLVARAIHASSSRKHRPFVVLNCAALPETLADSELFGHVRGAFSGARLHAEGLFRAADGGTLLLDEVGELPLSLQAKLLRVLQVGRVRPVGASGEVPVDVRVIAATNRDLSREVAAGSFREDVFARLDGPGIEVPSLDERWSDVMPLFATFLVQAGGDASTLLVSHTADRRPPPVPLDGVLAMLRYRWPRNVRELERYVARLVADNQYETRIKFPRLHGPTDVPEPATRARPDPDTIRRVLEEQDFIVRQAAKALDVPRTTLDRWMQEIGVHRPCDLDAPTIRSAVEQAKGDLARAASALKVSPRGLRLRLTELERDG